MPNRIIKESVCTSETLSEISAGAERLFWRLIVSADDFGCFDARANVILGKCLTAFIGRVTEEQVNTWLLELAQVGLVRLYSFEGRPYLHITTWDKHQRTRATKPKYPLPTADDGSCKHLLSIDSKREQPRTSAALFVNENVNENVNDNVDAQVNDTRTRAHASESEKTDDDEDGEKWREFGHWFSQAFGGLPNEAHFREAQTFLDDGLTMELVIEALRIAALNKANGWGYVCRILQNWLKDKILTLADFEAKEKARDSPVADDEEYGPRSRAIRSALRRLAEGGVTDAAS